jgi:hypothetical protein
MVQRRRAEKLAHELHSESDDDVLVASREIVSVPISKLSVGDSPRLNGIDLGHLRNLADVDEALPPIIVHHSTMRIIDGMHRLEAARSNGKTEIEVRFFFGDWAAGFRLAVRANVAHGLPLTQADRQAAARRIIQSQPQLSDRSIARTAGLAAKTVARIRRQTADTVSDLRIGEDGKVRPLSTEDGRRIASRLIEDRPGASLREIAQEAGISVGTVRDVRARLESGEDPVPSRRGASPRASSCAGGRGVTARSAPDPVDVDRLIDTLRRDPSLRYSESGRAMLRWLGRHAVTLTRAHDAIDDVPTHCANVVANIAYGCADAWNSIASELDRRARECA